jgi:hypothetical protein
MYTADRPKVIVEAIPRPFPFHLRSFGPSAQHRADPVQSEAYPYFSELMALCSGTPFSGILSRNVPIECFWMTVCHGVAVCHQEGLAPSVPSTNPPPRRENLEGDKDGTWPLSEKLTWQWNFTPGWHSMEIRVFKDLPEGMSGERGKSSRDQLT